MKIEDLIESKTKTMTDLSGKKTKVLFLKNETEIEAFKEQLRFDSLTSKEAIDYEICAKRKDKEENLKNWAVALFFGTAFIVVFVLLLGWLGS